MQGKWSKQEVNVLISLALSRTPHAEIAKRLGRSTAGVKRKLHRYRESLESGAGLALRYCDPLVNYDGLKVKAQKLRRKGIPVSRISAIVGMSESWVCKWTRPPRCNIEKWRRWGDRYRNRLVVRANILRDEGLSCEEIGRRLGLSDTWASKWTKRKRQSLPQERMYALHAICKAYSITKDIDASIRVVRKSDIVGRFIENMEEPYVYNIDAFRANRAYGGL